MLRGTVCDHFQSVNELQGHAVGEDAINATPEARLNGKLN